MGMFVKITGLLVVASAVFLFVKLNGKVPVPKLEENKWWGPGSPQKEDTSIRPFRIDVSDEVIQDLNSRLNRALPYQPPLEGVNQNYGINTKLLKTIVDYWKTKYDWKQRQEFLNQFPQFKTKIQGLDIHFLHVKPKTIPQGIQVLPLLLLHGWPGSVREFYEIIPILTTHQKGVNFVFEVIAPSLPGYGYSDGAVRPGMGPAQIGQIFNKLMNRLKFDKYYVQGGDWGSVIGQSMAVLFTKNVIGLHRNVCFSMPLYSLKTYIGSVLPQLFFTQKEIEKTYPLGTKYFGFLILESGYFHLQATKPDTVGVALRDSPVGLAAYIIEKFITWTNPAWKDLEDGGLTKKYTMDQLLDNVMIYWVTRSITTSMRLYSESQSSNYRMMKIDRIPVTIPTGCNRFEHELMYAPETILRDDNHNLIHLTDFEDGGHFAALELPEVLGNDIFQFVKKVRDLPQDRRNASRNVSVTHESFNFSPYVLASDQSKSKNIGIEGIFLESVVNQL